jgi:hypothetical protein
MLKLLTCLTAISLIIFGFAQNNVLPKDTTANNYSKNYYTNQKMMNQNKVLQDSIIKLLIQKQQGTNKFKNR